MNITISSSLLKLKRFKHAHFQNSMTATKDIYNNIADVMMGPCHFDRMKYQNFYMYNIALVEELI